MHHVDPETLALMALGEVIGDDVARSHLASCAVCGAEVESLRRVVLVGRSTTDDDIPLPPPARVWDRVQAELGLGGVSAPPSGGGGATVTELPTRRRRSAGWIAGAAAAGVLVGSIGGAWWASRPAPVPDSTILAEATLDALPGWDASGVALVEEGPEGSRVVVVDVEAPLGEDGFREVWLIAPDLSGMVSLGLLEGSSGRFAVPAGIDLSAYPVVDVSEEPFDGDATHSGNSIVRGTLGA